MYLHFVIEMIWWTGLAAWDFEFPIPGSFMSTSLHWAIISIGRVSFKKTCDQPTFADETLHTAKGKLRQIEAASQRKKILARIARGQTNRLTFGVTSPLQGAEVRILRFSPLKRGRVPGSQTMCLPPDYPGKKAK